ncbi:MAG: hypothetical protein PHI70_05510 [Proteiniphilum sp.]|nr:hypothetical protein [Proteiniphilum sp.]MDD4416222.1 hypothetical protein [Proteiniphilum sp.]
MENKQKAHQIVRKVRKGAMKPEELEQFLDSYLQKLQQEKTDRKKR